jgi:hypothetical protein
MFEMFFPKQFSNPINFLNPSNTFCFFISPTNLEFPHAPLP